MLSLPNVTLLAVSSVELQQTELALRISSHDIDFGSIQLLTSESWTPSDPKINVVKIPKLDFVGYSRFVLCELTRFVQTQYCLIVQADGFVLNASQWRDEFLNYDYIGAPWPRNLKLQPGDILLGLEQNVVGNGGFSLRSKALLNATAKIDFDNLSLPTKSEDLIICHYLHGEMVNAGIKFPAPELAAAFSIESPSASYGQNPNTSFGFHGKDLRNAIFSGFSGS